MLRLLKNIVKLSVLFVALYMCSICVVGLFDVFGATFSNVSNTAFYATLLAMILLFVLQRKSVKRKDKEDDKK